jgi:TRAP-type transport system small permease protein
MAERADLPIHEADGGSRGKIARSLEQMAFVIGSIGLLIAMTTDTLAVLGRHLGIPLLGSIEVMQASVVLAASAAMVGATLRGAHASVHILVDRLGPGAKRVLHRIADGLGAVVFCVFAAGSIWIAKELWGGHELTELLHIPLRWLRVLWIAAAIMIAAILIVRALAPRKASQ